MKTKYQILAALAIGAALAGCAKQEVIESPVINEDTPAVPDLGGQVVTVRATSGTLTKVSADDSGVYTWEEGDVIGVWTGSEITPFTLVASSAGSAEGEFSGTLPSGGAIDENSYAVYPYGNVTVSGTTAKLNVNSSFWARKAPTRLVPMYAKPGTGHTTGFEFKLLSAVVKFTINNLPEEIIAIYLEMQGSSSLAKHIWASSSSEADLTVDNPQLTGGGNEGYALAVPGEAASYKSIDFYVPVLPGEYYEGLTFKVKLFKDSGAAEVGEYTKTGPLSKKSTTYTRGQLIVLPAINYPKTVASGISATIQNNVKWNMGATMGLYNGSGFNVMTLDDSAVDKYTGTFSGTIPGSLSYAVTPATGPALSGATFNYNISRYEYTIYPVTYGKASDAETFEMKHLTALLKVTVQNVPVEATNFYFEAWGGANLMTTAVNADLSASDVTPSYGDGIDWAFAAIPAHTDVIPELTVYVPIKAGTFDNQLNWCLCYTSAAGFGNELSDKTRFWNITPASPEAISVGDVFDLGSVTLTMK